jgi:hypothetical protein
MPCSLSEIFLRVWSEAIAAAAARVCFPPARTLHAGMDSLIFQQRSLFWFPLFELLLLDSIVSEEHNTSSAAMAYLVNKKKPCFFFLAFVSFFIFLVFLEVVHFSEAAIIIIDLKHDTKRRGGRGAWPFSWFCFLVMLPHGEQCFLYAFAAWHTMLLLCFAASRTMLLQCFFYGFCYSFLFPLRRVWK